MMMKPGVRKLALTAHVICSVSWSGAVASFLILGVAGLTSQDTQIVRAAYVAMDLTGWFVIVPLCFAALLTGLVQALGTPWGLFRHYWIVMKLLITVLSTLLLLVHMQPTTRLAGAAIETLSDAHLGQMRIQLVADAGLALLALLVATTLAVYKPRGVTSYGARKEAAEAAGAASTAGMPRWVKILALTGIGVLFIGRMFAGHGGPHGPGRHLGAIDALAQHGQQPLHQRFDDAERWSKIFDDPERDAWQKPEEVIRALKLPPAAVVVDIGSGTGYFAVRLARALPRGRVFGADLEPDMVRYLNERAAREKLPNLSSHIAAADDPRLPEPVDLALVVNTYHHIGDRQRYFSRLKKSLKPQGRVAIVDFKPDSPVGPPKRHRIAANSVADEMTRAGYGLEASRDFLPYQFVLIFRPR